VLQCNGAPRHFLLKWKMNEPLITEAVGELNPFSFRWEAFVFALKRAGSGLDRKERGGGGKIKRGREILRENSV